MFSVYHPELVLPLGYLLPCSSCLSGCVHLWLTYNLVHKCHGLVLYYITRVLSRAASWVLRSAAQWHHQGPRFLSLFCFVIFMSLPFSQASLIPHDQAYILQKQYLLLSRFKSENFVFLQILHWSELDPNKLSSSWTHWHLSHCHRLLQIKAGTGVQSFSQGVSLSTNVGF